MKLRYLIVNSLINESSRCGIHNSLIKHRPDLKDEMDTIEGRDIESSTAFLKKNGLWDDHAEALLGNYKQWEYEFRSSLEKYDQDKMFEHLNKLMCHVAKLIRQSAVSIAR